MSARPRTARRASRARGISVWLIALLVALVATVQIRSEAEVERSLVGIDSTSLAFLIDGVVVVPPWKISVIGDVNRLAAVAVLMAQQLRADRRVREATYRIDSDVVIRSVISERPFVYAVAS